jgi:alpha-D-xyloside xylohydrolase
VERQILVITSSQPALEYHNAEHVLRGEPWGSNSVRVRAARHTVTYNVPGALELSPPASDAHLVVSDPTGQGAWSSAP